MPLAMSKKRKMRSIHGLRAYVGRVLTELEDHGKAGDPERARVMIYGAKVLAELIDKGHLEERLKALEKRLEPGGADAVQ